MADHHDAGPSARQADYVRGRLAQARQARAAIPRLSAIAAPEPSFAQERLWFLDRLEPDATTYCRSLNLRLRGALDVAAFSVAALERSLRHIVQRHAPLRTAFASVDGRPVPVTQPTARFTLRRAALPTPAGDARDEAIRQLALQEIGQPFDLARDFMLRATLVELADDDALLLLTMHHIATDGWSDGVLLHELGRLYAGFAAHEPVELPPLAVEYADYAAWQRQSMRGEALERRLAYWRRQLAGVAPLLLPADRPRSAAQEDRGALADFVVPAELAGALRGLSQRAGVTLYMTLLAAFQVLLARYTGQHDIAVGSPMANRPHPELEPLIGYFANTLVLRTDLAGDPPFAELLQRVRQVALGAYEHQDTPFEKVVEALQPDRNLGQNPLFQVLFALQNVPEQAIKLPGITVERLPGVGEAAKFELSLAIRESAAGLTGRFEYRTDLFDAATVQRMAGHFLTLLEGLAAEPQRRIAELPLLTADERRQILVEWNRTRVDWPALPCVHQLVAEQAQRTPAAVAVMFEGTQLTYGELEVRAGRLARALRQHGVAPGRRVALFLERSPDMVVAILGVLKAGGAYVPLDPAHPQARIDFTLADSQPEAVVTQARLAGRMAAFGGPTLLMDVHPWPETDGDCGSDTPAAGPGDPAYVLYTSGSTGQPKGVQIPHGALSNYVLAHRLEMSICPQDVMPALATYAFDVSVEENLIPLTVGACVAIASRAVAADGQQLAAFLAAVGATILDVTPATWRLLLAAGWQARPGLRLLSGGEELPRSLAEQLLAHGALLWNLYGPTETTIFSTIAQVTPGAGPVSIGRPIANTQVYILDPRGQPVPIGVAGELVIGGAGLALGYLDRPQLTAERFVPHPFAAEVDGNTGARLYRTGDLARYRPDGSIEYLGRTDFQVKLRGHRIELGEIEAVLAQHPGVRECVVALTGDTLDDRRLVAYWIPRPGQAAGPDDLRRHLRGRLPDYMAPAAYVTLDAWPLTPSGKIDRRRLPQPEARLLASRAEYVAPRTPVEAAIAAIWAEVLGVDAVGIHDNFFELGGHSLLATQVVARMADRLDRTAGAPHLGSAAHLGGELSIRTMFLHPTVAELAAHLPNSQPDSPPLGAGEATLAAPGVQMAPPGRAELRPPLSWAQVRLWFLDQLEPGQPTYNIAQAHRIRGELDRPALACALAEIVRRHAVLRTVYAAEDGAPVQQVRPFDAVPVALVDLRSVPPAARTAEVQRLAAEEARKPFDLTQDLMLRATLLKLGEQEHMLLLTVHHIAWDGWSDGVFWRELDALYAACAAGQPSPLAEPGPQYVDFAAWQRRWLQGERLGRQLAYWRRRLDGLAPLTLPTDAAPPSPSDGAAGCQRTTLPADLADKLRGLARQEGVTDYVLLLAAFQVLLHRYTGQTDIAVGTPVANRSRLEFEQTIGFFVNTLVMRGDLSGNPSFRRHLHAVHRATLEALAHQDLPFEQLVEDLHVERQLRRMPLVNVLFNWEPAAVEPRLAGLTVEPVASPAPNARFDLTLYVHQHGRRTDLRLVYRTYLFSEDRMAEFLRQIVHLLAQVVEQPDRPVGDYALVTDHAVALLPDPSLPLDEPAYPGALASILQGAGDHPTRPAVEQGARVWTYGELAHTARRVAAGLQAAGLRRGDVVALAGPRSFALVTGLLGISLAGGVFLPLAPDLPANRRASMLDDAAARFLLEVTENGAGAASLHLRCLADDGRGILLHADDDGDEPRAWRLPAAEDPAYVFFTSGSTGRPKGILGQHKGLAHFLDWQRRAFAVGAGDRVSWLTHLSFDPVLRDLFLPLTSGATLCLPPCAGMAPEEELAWLAEAGVTVVHGVPSCVRYWLQATEEAPRLPVRVTFLAGEPLAGDLVERWRGLCPAGCQVVNLYGPTETTMAKAYHVVPPGSQAGIQPIGRPLPETQLWVVNQARQLCGVGEPGEIVVRTPFRTLGYIHPTAEDAARFQANWFTGDARDVVFLTGDLGRYQPDGSISILGRKDRQVKVGGVRVEPEEVEAVLGRHADVQECAVLAVDDGSGAARLTAYVASVKPPPAVAELRRHLLDWLPVAMVPGAFVFLKRLPRLPNGKVDRRALAALNLEHVTPAPAFVAPRTTLERVLADIWFQVLAVEQIGVEDDFFRLGGHSLAATRMLARIQVELGASVGLREFFEQPTIASLATAILASTVAHMAAAGRLELIEGLEIQ